MPMFGEEALVLSKKHTDKKVNEVNEQLTKTVKKVNGKSPDINGNVIVEGTGGGNVDLYFEAPPQPSFNKFDTGFIWDGEGRTQDDFRKEMIDPLVATVPKYVTKNFLGRDTSDTYDIHEYVFTPDSYEQTILLTSGVHGRETVPVYSMYRLMHYLINEPDVHPDIKYLRENVRICIIPVVNPWGGSNLVEGTSNKHYGNVNGSSITRNVSFEWEMAGDARGKVPFSENEAKILWDWVTKYKNIASFYLDNHTNWSPYISAPPYDNWVNLTWNDEYATPVINQVVSYLNNRVRRLYGKEPVNNVDVTTGVGIRYYAQHGCNIPCATIEYCETRFGGRFGGSIDIQNHLTIMVNYISALTKANLIKQRENREMVGLNYISPQNFSFHSLNEDINAAVFSNDLHQKYDKYIATPPPEITVSKSILNKDSTGLYDIVKYTFEPKNYEKTLFIYAGLFSRQDFKDVFILQNLIKYIYTSNHFIAERLRKYYRFIIIPVVNVGVFNKSIGTYNKTGLPNRTGGITTIGGSNIIPDFGTFSLPESQAIKKVVENNIIDLSIELGSNYGLAEVVVNNFNNFSKSLYSSAKFAENTFKPRTTGITYDIASSLPTASRTITVNELNYLSQQVPEPCIFRVGDSPFALGDPIYKSNMVEMRRFTEILINSLYMYMTTNFTKEYKIEPVNLVPPLYDSAWTLHATASLLEDKTGIKFTPTANSQGNDIIVNVTEGAEYYASFDKILPTSPLIKLSAFRVAADGTVGTEIKFTTEKEMSFIIPSGYPKLRLSIRSSTGQTFNGETIVIKNVKLYKVNK